MKVKLEINHLFEQEASPLHSQHSDVEIRCDVTCEVSLVVTSIRITDIEVNHDEELIDVAPKFNIGDAEKTMRKYLQTKAGQSEVMDALSENLMCDS